MSERAVMGDVLYLPPTYLPTYLPTDLLTKQLTSVLPVLARTSRVLSSLTLSLSHSLCVCVCVCICICLSLISLANNNLHSQSVYNTRVTELDCMFVCYVPLIGIPHFFSLSLSLQLTQFKNSERVCLQTTLFHSISLFFLGMQIDKRPSLIEQRHQNIHIHTLLRDPQSWPTLITSQRMTMTLCFPLFFFFSLVASTMRLGGTLCVEDSICALNKLTVQLMH